MSNQVSPLDFLKTSTEYADEQTSQKRFDICKTCPELIRFTKQCKQCGCFMILKTKLKDATCPLGNWQ